MRFKDAKREELGSIFNKFWQGALKFAMEEAGRWEKEAVQDKWSAEELMKIKDYQKLLEVLKTEMGKIFEEIIENC